MGQQCPNSPKVGFRHAVQQRPCLDRGPQRCSSSFHIHTTSNKGTQRVTEGHGRSRLGHGCRQTTLKAARCFRVTAITGGASAYGFAQHDSMPQNHTQACANCPTASSNSVKLREAVGRWTHSLHRCIHLYRFQVARSHTQMGHGLAAAPTKNIFKSHVRMSSALTEQQQPGKECERTSRVVKHGLQKMKLAFRLSFKESMLEAAPVRIRSALRSVLPCTSSGRRTVVEASKDCFFTKTRSPGIAFCCGSAQTTGRLIFQT